MRILLTNDDGVYAKGLAVLGQSLKGVAELDIVAPDRNRSGASNSLTLDVPIHVKRIENGVISVEGTPTDCVHLAITGLLPNEPDMVVSGINQGANLADDVIYSGTVAAAMEGRFLGKPAIAISLTGEQYLHYETAGAVARILVEQLIIDPLPSGTILNVNVPDVHYSELRGFEVTRLGSRHRAQPVITQQDPRGRTVYWVGLAGNEQDVGPGSDFYAIKRNKVAITPLQVDLTNYRAFDQLSHWITGLNK
ncbi:MAG: 5'/3'-nucleotidase SurE [Coxiellaceae bacterium]|nr:MAG: 5'/3'-nucleotidase SurE [Coxiellaceae bacterium]